MKAALAALLLVLPLAAGAQTYKCKDRQGNVTYSNETCAKQGLIDAGEVRDRVTTLPTAPLEKKSAEKTKPSRTDNWNSGATEPGRSRP